MRRRHNFLCEVYYYYRAGKAYYCLCATFFFLLLCFPSGSCIVDVNCRSNQVCERSQCKDPCTLRDACGVNANCQTSGHKKACSCPPSFTGNPEVECVRVPTICVNNLDCPENMACNEGICMIGCGSDNECAVNERCNAGLCTRKLRLHVPPKYERVYIYIHTHYFSKLWIVV